MLHLNKLIKTLGKENKNIVLVCFISLKLYLVIKREAQVCAWQDVVKCPRAPNNNNRKKKSLKHSQGLFNVLHV